MTPFAFCYDPGILLQGTLVQNVYGILACVAACFGFGFAIMGYLNRDLKTWERVVFVIFAVMGLSPNEFVTTAGAVGVIVAWIIFAKVGKKKTPTAAAV